MSSRVSTEAQLELVYRPIRPSNHDWDDSAACVSSGEDMSPSEERLTKHKIQEQRRIISQICAVCALRQVCLDDAIMTEEDNGIRGGTTAAERKRLIKEHRKNGYIRIVALAKLGLVRFSEDGSILSLDPSRIEAIPA